jgi:uncharacterized Zn finger protein
MSHQDDTPEESLVRHYWNLPDTEPLLAKNGARSSSQTGEFAKSWWAGRWLRALTRLIDAAGLARGRAYARGGQVVDMHVQVGIVLAHVQGTRHQPYNVRLEIKTLTEAEWERAIQAMASQAIYAAQLLNGEMPQGIEESFNSVGVSLFPASVGELKMTCSCPELTTPCKHMAAIFLLLGELLDEDPFTLFAIRGRTKEQIMTALREKRAALAASPILRADQGPAPRPLTFGEQPLGDCLHSFWQMGEEIQSLKIQVTPPPVEMELLKIMGDPAFAEDDSLQERLAEVYRIVSQRALDAAFEH